MINLLVVKTFAYFNDFQKIIDTVSSNDIPIRVCCTKAYVKGLLTAPMGKMLATLRP